MATKVNIINWDELDWQPIREKMRKKCFNPAGCTIQIAEIEKGHTPGPHKHIYEQVAYILQGECDFYVDGYPYHMTPGTIMAVPPMSEHYIVATSDETVINLDIFTPVRPEYKQGEIVRKIVKRPED
ncbi:MAG: cupin domain-containing protein [Clostridia bacterium]|jgi:quercetin dioxygenase-like cupin family protein|nr:cupin domain-containing protein [Clostridia bacterium]MCI2015935.1 cupin domain-containing protein [Clostridia bacterium]